MLEMFLKFIKIGFTAFGGGSVIIALIQKEFVDSGYIKSADFINALALSQATPGPVAGSLATYIGYKLFGVIGIFVAVIGVSLPTFLIVIIFSELLRHLNNNRFVEDIFKILRPVVISLVISVFIYLFQISVLKDENIVSLHQFFASADIKAALLLVFVSIIMLKYRKHNPVYFILGSAILGMLIL